MEYKINHVGQVFSKEQFFKDIRKNSKEEKILIMLWLKMKPVYIIDKDIQILEDVLELFNKLSKKNTEII
jgi:hypothetical protein